MIYPNLHNDVAIPHSSRGLVIVPGSVKITFNINIVSTETTLSIVKNVGRALVKKKLLMIGS